MYRMLAPKEALKVIYFTLTSAAQLVGHCPAKPKVAGSTPGQGVCERWSMFLSLSFSLPSPLSKNKLMKSFLKSHLFQLLHFTIEKKIKPREIQRQSYTGLCSQLILHSPSLWVSPSSGYFLFQWRGGREMPISSAWLSSELHRGC